MTTAPTRTFSAALRAFRATHPITGTALAAKAGIPARSISRWERTRARPRDAEVRKLIAAVATIHFESALEMSSILGLMPPADPTPPPPPAPPPIQAREPGVIATPTAPPMLEPPTPPVPAELAIDPVEAAMFRAAEALGISPTPLRPVLARFLGHLAALGLSPAEAQIRLG